MLCTDDINLRVHDISEVWVWLWAG